MRTPPPISGVNPYTYKLGTTPSPPPSPAWPAACSPVMPLSFIPTASLAFQTSVQILLMPVIGGLGTVWGGGDRRRWYSALLKKKLVARFPQIHLFLYGGLLIVIIWSSPAEFWARLASSFAGSGGCVTRQEDKRAPILQVDHLTKFFGGLAAVRDVSFEVRRGQIFGFIGPNGAGKTTLFSMIAGALQADLRARCCAAART